MTMAQDTMTYSPTTFSQAIVRTPAESVIDGLRAEDLGAPNFEALLKEHETYCEALTAAGLAVTVLPPMEAYPDSIFVEDPALVFPQGAILLRPGAQSRAGEVAAIKPCLDSKFDIVLSITDGHVDGGDILVTPQQVFIGLSDRTNERGGEALIEALKALGLTGTMVRTPDTVLHLKTACSLIDDETIFCVEELADYFPALKTVIVPNDERPAANILRLNDQLLMSAGYAKSNAILLNYVDNIVELPTDEILKIDAGLSCMSLRW